MRYRRADVSGATYFVTVNLAEGNRTLLVVYVAVLRAAMKEVNRRHPFHIDAVVVLPDHLQAVWTLLVGDCDYPIRWMLIKAGFSRRVPKGERRNESWIAKGERGCGSALVERPTRKRTTLGCNHAEPNVLYQRSCE